MIVRDFRLINKNGNVIELMDSNLIFVGNPDGLGATYNIEYLSDVDNNVLNVKSTYELKDISFEIYFKDYNLFNEFSNKLTNEMVLEYDIPNVGIFTKDVILKELSKTEIKENDYIKSKLILTSLSRWKGERQIKQVNNEIDGSKKYTYTYPYIYGLSGNKVDIFNPTNRMLFLKIELLGAFTNPTVQITQNEKVLYECAYNFVSNSNGIITINGFPREQEVNFLDTNDGTTFSLYQYQDFTKSTFVKLPPGRSVFSVSGGDKTTSCNIYYQLEMDLV